MPFACGFEMLDPKEMSVRKFGIKTILIEKKNIRSIYLLSNSEPFESVISRTWSCNVIEHLVCS